MFNSRNINKWLKLQDVNPDDFENKRVPPTKVADENLMEISRCQTKLDTVTHKVSLYAC